MQAGWGACLGGRAPEAAGGRHRPRLGTDTRWQPRLEKDKEKEREKEDKKEESHMGVYASALGLDRCYTSLSLCLLDNVMMCVCCTRPQ